MERGEHLEIVQDNTVPVYEQQEETSQREVQQKKISAETKRNSIVFTIQEEVELDKSLLLVDGIEQKLYSHLFSVDTDPGEHEIEYILFNEKGEVIDSNLEKVWVDPEPIELSVGLNGEFNSQVYYLEQAAVFHLEGLETIETITVTADGKEIEITDNSFVLDPSCSKVVIKAEDSFSQVKEIEFICRKKPNIEIHLSNAETGANKFYLTSTEAPSYPLYIENKDTLEKVSFLEGSLYEWKDLNSNTFSVVDEFGKTIQVLELLPTGAAEEKPSDQNIPETDIKKPEMPEMDNSQNLNSPEYLNTSVITPVIKEEKKESISIPEKPAVKPKAQIKLKANKQLIQPKKMQTFHTLPEMELSSNIPTEITYEIDNKEKKFQTIEEALSSLNANEVLEVKVSSSNKEVSEDSKVYAFMYQPIETSIEQERQFNYEGSQILLKKDKELIFEKNKPAESSFEIKVTKHFNSIEEETVYEKDTVRIWLKQMDPNNPVEFTQLVINGNPILKDEIKKDSLNQPYYEVKVKNEPYNVQIKAADKLGNEVSREIFFETKPNSNRIFRWAFYFVISILSGWLFKSRKRHKRVYYSNWNKGH